MAAVSGLGTTYNLPNYTGTLHLLTPTDTPFFSAIGGLNGGESTDSTSFEWQTEDIADASQPENLEGADAPTAEERARANVSNVVQIHQETVSIAYSKLAATGLKSGINNGQPNPVTNERDHQIGLKLKKIARDIEYSFINGVYQAPANNSTGRKTRGILAAISTNVVTAETLVGDGGSTWEADDEVITEANHGLAVGDRVRIAITSGATGATAGYFYVRTVPSSSTFTVSTTKSLAAVQAITADGVVDVYKQPAVTVTHIEDLLQSVYSAGGIMETDTAALLVGAAQKRGLSAAYAAAYGKFQETSRTVAGVAVDTIITNFGTLNVMLDRHMPAGTIAAVSLEMCKPRYLNIPGKGEGIFAEPLATTGSAEKWQLYGEVGLEYGAETAHGKITNLFF